MSNAVNNNTVVQNILHLARTNLTFRIFIGMILGIVIGYCIQLSYDDSGDLVIALIGIDFSFKAFFVNGIFELGGTIFINSLRMLVVPLVFVSLVCGVSGLSDPSKMGRLGGKSLLLYVLTTCIAVTFALIAALIVKPGIGFERPESINYVVKEAPGLVQVVINMFTSNPVASLAQGNMLQIIIFSIVFGIAITKAGDHGKRIQNAFEAMNEVIMQIVTIVMNLAPYGVFFLMAKLGATIDFGDLAYIGKYFFLVLAVLILHALITFPILLVTLARLNPLLLFLKVKELAVFAFSSSSSAATLPITMATARDKLGVKKSVASFTIPLGATINMDGTAIMQGVATVFIAQAYGVDLTTSQLLMVVLTATLASIGTAGVPGVGLIMLAMVLQQVNLPVDGIALIIGIDRLLDMTRTVVNVTGDCTVACIVAKSEKELDESVYNDKSL
ncbi:MAG: Na+/H+-dicarboxylate symporter [Alphaproteobacteria bacterium]|jgi:Na+/H+-dicarboxylate symporter